MDFRIFKQYERFSPPVRVIFSTENVVYCLAWMVSWSPEGFVTTENGLTFDWEWEKIIDFSVMADTRPGHYSTEVVADMFFVNQTTIRRWVKEGKLAAVKTRNRWSITRESIEALLKEKGQ